MTVSKKEFQSIFTFLTFMLIVSDGILRKWVLRGNDNQILILKYIFLFFLSVYAFRKLKTMSEFELKNHGNFLGTLFLINFTCIASFALNGGDLKSFIIYLQVLPLYFVAILFLHSYVYNKNFDIILIIFSVTNSIVSIMQFYMPPDAFVNARVLGGEDSIASFGITDQLGNYIQRTYGLFSYLTPNSSFIALVSALHLGLISNELNHTQTKSGLKWLNVIGLILAFYAAFSTGSRGLLLIMSIMTFVFLVYNFRKSFLLIFIILLSINVSGLFGSLSDAYFFRAASANNEEASYRWLSALLMPYTTLMESDIFGSGPGNTVVSVSGKFYNETEVDRLGTEIGFFIFFIIYMFKIYYTIYAIRFMASSSDLRFVLSPLLVFLIFQIPSIPVHNFNELFGYLLSIVIVTRFITLSKGLYS